MVEKSGFDITHLLHQKKKWHDGAVVWEFSRANELSFDPQHGRLVTGLQTKKNMLLAA